MLTCCGLMLCFGETRARSKRTYCTFTPADQEAHGQPDVQDPADLRCAGTRGDGRGCDPAE